MLLLVFKACNGMLQHSNIAMTPGFLSGILATSDVHRFHHSSDLDESNTNFGNATMIWDRIFGTYCGDESSDVKQIGAGKGKPLSIKEQLMLAFYPNKRLVDL